MSKKQIIQLVVLVLFLYMGVYSLLSGFGLCVDLMDYVYGYDVYFALISVLLLLGIYVSYSQTDYKFVKYLRILLYFFVFFIVIDRIKMYCSIYNYYSIPFETDFFWLKVVSGIGSFFVSFWMILAILTSGVLIFNKPPKTKILKIGRWRIGL